MCRPAAKCFGVRSRVIHHANWRLCCSWGACSLFPIRPQQHDSIDLVQRWASLLASSSSLFIRSSSMPLPLASGLVFKLDWRGEDEEAVNWRADLMNSSPSETVSTSGRRTDESEQDKRKNSSGRGTHVDANDSWQQLAAHIEASLNGNAQDWF